MRASPVQPASQGLYKSEAPYDQLMDAAETFNEQVEQEGRKVEHMKAEIAELKAEAHALAEDTGAA